MRNALPSFKGNSVSSVSFWQKLETSMRARDSLLCVGLDPRREQIPPHYATLADFNRAIIDATAHLACIYKPNIAFYEALGRAGMDALRETIAYVPEDIPVLLDAKRNDIASTAQAYAKAAFEDLGADALTVNPYLGADGVAPFLEYEERGVFLLCKTSNPSAGELQDWSQGGVSLYRHVAQLAESWAGGRAIGLVVGATYPEILAQVRAAHPNAWFLVPGVGTQGGDLEAVVHAGLRADGLGLLINSSRGIIHAEDPRAAAATLHRQINAARKKASLSPALSERDAEVRLLSRVLYEADCLRFGDFVLHSGAHSPVYVDMRRLVTYPRALDIVARSYVKLLNPLQYDRIAAIPYAALPIGTAVALQTGDPLIYPRHEAKVYGTRQRIEGEFQPGERAVLLDDLITRGGSKLEARQVLVEEGLIVEDVVVLLDREQGGTEDLAQQGVRLHAALTLREAVDSLAGLGLLDSADARRVRDYLAGEP